MHAFGLEETGDYARAEAQGRKSVEMEPRDGWRQHAVAHVMEMQGRRRDGITWMRANPEAWSRDSFFAVHPKNGSCLYVQCVKSDLVRAASQLLSSR